VVGNRLSDAATDWQIDENAAGLFGEKEPEAHELETRKTYVAVEPFHLERYIDEQVFRFNNRATKDNPLNDSDRFLLALSQVAGRRLTFAELTGKGDASPL
jgi:hypothetical protein